MGDSRKADAIAIITLAFILALTAAALFIWMSVIGWSDQTGLIVGIIFITLTLLQGGLSGLWWKITGQKQMQYEMSKEQLQQLSAPGQAEQCL